jgi:hypothetical protein
LKKIIDNKPLLIILVSGFVLKLLYLFFIGPAVFPNWTLTTQDSFSYTNSFINLVNTGHYTHDPEFIEASYGRLPVVVFLWGLFYMLFGETNAFIGVAVFQILLDVLAVYLVYKIFSKLFYEKMGLIVSFVYAFFPLTIYFVVKTDTEYLALFTIILVFYKLIYFKNDLKDCLSLVLLLIFGFYIRETLLLLIPVSVFYLQRNFDIGAKKYLLMSLLFVVLYLPWPVRNYMLSEKLVLIKPLSAGYADYQKDMLNYMYWLYAWHCDQPDEYLAYAYKPEREIKFPEDIFANETEKQLAINTIRLGQKCGTSFVVWQRDAGVKTKCYGCYDDLIASSFLLLKDSYRRNHPFNYYIKVPLQNSTKAFFKSSLTNSAAAPESVFKIIMWIRSLLLVIGFGACFYYRKLDYFKITLIFFTVKYIFIVAVLRQVEMRYLFQADVLIILAATAFIADRFFKKKIVK